MGSLWEPYGKGVPFFGAPGNSLDHYNIVLRKFARGDFVNILMGVEDAPEVYGFREMEIQGAQPGSPPMPPTPPRE